MRFFKRKKDKDDFSNFFGENPKSSKDILIEKAYKDSIPIYADNHNEVVSGPYSIFRTPASEAELYARRMAFNANRYSKYALIISGISIILSIISFFKTL